MMSRQHLGLLLVLAGTIAVAFSVSVRRLYDGEAATAVDRAKREDPGLLEPTEVRILPFWFRGGLALVAVGTALQW